MTLLYLTADSIGTPTGGGNVTAQELLALREFAGRMTVERRDPELSDVLVLSRDGLGSGGEEPWKWDDVAVTARDWYVVRPRLAHIYSGTWPKTVANLKRNGCKVVITIAAHDREVSRREHEKLGLPFPYTHLTDPNLWKRYIEGYRLADVIVCPSSVAANTVRAYGPEFEKKRIEIIPHGCHLPDEVKPLPKTFVCGYLGSYGADKGVAYLLQAWKKLNYKDGSLLMLGGRDSTTPWVRQLVQQYGGGSVHLAGWQKDVGTFYNSISCYCQSSATEGFGIEVVEAMSFSRPVICSKGAGAVDAVTEQGNGRVVPACNVDALAQAIDSFKKAPPTLVEEFARDARRTSENYTWAKVRGMYQKLWEELA